MRILEQKADPNYEQQDLDLWGVDYETNKNLPDKVEPKPLIESNLLMRFRSQLNKVVWKGLNSAQTKILTVVFSKIGDQLALYQKQEIDNYVKEQQEAGKKVTKKEINEKLKNLDIPNTVSARLTYNELRRESGFRSNASIPKYVDELKPKLEGWREIKSQGVTASFPIFKGIINDENRKIFDFVINDFMVRILLISPDGNFVRYPAREIISLSNTRAQTLLRLLKRFRNTGKAIFRKHTNYPDKGEVQIGLWEQLEIPSGTKESHFTNRILKEAIIEISPYFSQLNYSKKLGVVNGHQAVISYVFTFKPETKAENHANDHIEAVKLAGLLNINSTPCLSRDDKFKAIDKFLRQKKGTAKREYLAVHPEESKKEDKKDNEKIDLDMYKPAEAGMSVSDFHDKELGKKVFASNIKELEKISDSILKKVRQNQGDMYLVNDYTKVQRLLQRRRALKNAKNIK